MMTVFQGFPKIVIMTQVCIINIKKYTFNSYIEMSVFLCSDVCSSKFIDKM